MVIYHQDGTVEFVYFRPGARMVRLSGDFNDWRNDGRRLTRDAQGWWRLRMALPAGEYRFKYLVDEDIWEADFAAYGVEFDKVGGWNSVLWVPEPVAVTRAAA